jgi:pimeloyl-ACP methyl ester carboxylesterase
MTAAGELGLLFLHALPLGGAMWAAQERLLPGSSCAPTLYRFGDSLAAWAAGALSVAKGERLIVVGCSVGGSCALEVAAIAPDRVAAIVLIGTKAAHRPDPALHAAALRTIESRGAEAAWSDFWEPLFSRAASREVIEDARQVMLRQSPADIARGVSVFHTRPSRTDVLSTFPRPVVLVTGADDVAPGRATSEAQAAAAPRRRLHVIPDCGHYVPLEQPEQLNAILEEVIEARGQERTTEWIAT